MPYENPFYKTPLDLEVEKFTPLIEAALRANADKANFTLPQLKAALGAEGGNLTKRVAFLCFMRLGIISGEGVE